MELYSTGKIFEDKSELLQYAMTFVNYISMYDNYQFLTYQDYANNHYVNIELHFRDKTKKIIYEPPISYVMNCETIYIYEESEVLLPKEHPYFETHLQLTRGQSDHYVRVTTLDPNLFTSLMVYLRNIKCSISFSENEINILLNNLNDSTKVSKLCLLVKEKIKKLVIPLNAELL